MTDQRRPQIIAHRGFAGVAPENTIGAFQALATEHSQASMIELDVVPCADGTPVVFHDDRLDDIGDSRGITDASGLVWETPLSEVQTAKVLDSNETVPTLEAVLSIIPSALAVNVELKHHGRGELQTRGVLSDTELTDYRERWDPFVRRVVDILAGFDNQTLLSSFAEAAIASVRNIAPSIPVAVLFSHSLEAGITVGNRYNCEALHPPISMVLNSSPSDGHSLAKEAKNLFAEAEKLDCAINVWTVQTWYQADRLCAAGVDGLIADYPHLHTWDDT